MPHKFLLGFKDDPSGSDDYISLYSSLDAANSGGLGSGLGYFMTGYSEGQPYTKDGLSVRDLILTVTIKGSSVDDVRARFARLRSYHEKTARFLKRFRANIPGTIDGSWFPGFAAVLTVQASGSSETRYWNVVDGDLPTPAPYLDTDLGSFVIQNALLTLTVQELARGQRVFLDNLINCGDFERPFKINDPQYGAGWTFTGSQWGIETYSFPASDTVPRVYPRSIAGSRSLTATFAAGTANTTITAASNSTLLPIYSKVLPSITIANYGASSQNQVTAVLQTSYDNSTWTNLQTFANYPDAAHLYTTDPNAAASLVTFTETAFTNPDQNTRYYYRILLTINYVTNASSSTTFYFSGAAVWLNPPNDTAPKEYFCQGGQIGIPNINIYGVQGDVAAPFQCFVHTPPFVNNRPVLRSIVLGGQQGDLLNGQPIAGLDVLTKGNFGTLGNVQQGQGNKVSIPNNYEWQLVQSTPLQNLPLDGIPRIYRMYLVYGLSLDNTFNSLQIYSNDLNLTYQVNLPRTSATVDATLTVSDMRIAEIGEIQFPPQNSNWTYSQPSFLNTDTRLELFASSSTIASNSTTGQVSIEGLIFVPTENTASLNFAPDQGPILDDKTLLFSSEGSSSLVGAAYQAEYNNNFYYDSVSQQNFSANYPINNTSSIQKFGKFSLTPGSNRFEILCLKDLDTAQVPSGIYSFDTTSQIHSFVAYSPRYRSIV